MLTTVILAGGLGKRMNSDIPKVLHKVLGKPMICYVIERAVELNPNYILIVVGKYKQIIEKTVSEYFPENDNIIYIDQPEPLGTGNAIKCILPFFIDNSISVSSNVLILSGDVPLIRHNTLRSLLTSPNSVMIYKSENPTGCGRIIFNDSYITHIVEEKDCTDEEKQIKYINCGIYSISLGILLDTIPLIENKNRSNEYYLTDFVKIAFIKTPLSFFELPEKSYLEIANINTINDLQFVENNLQNENLIYEFNRLNY